MLINFEIQRYQRSNGVYSTDNLPKTLKLSIEIIYFDSFGDEHVPKEVSLEYGLLGSF